MQLEHQFSVPVPVEVAWQALLDPERVAPCFPGATLTGVDGSDFSGTVKVRMGPISLLYKGTGRFTSTDEQARKVVLEATGKDSRGNGTASATVTATLAEAEAGTTMVGVVTDLTITGRPAQLGRGLVGEVGGKILDAFAGCLASELSGSGSAAGGTASVSEPKPQPEPEPVTRPASGPQPAADVTPVPTARPGGLAAPTRPATSADEIDLLGLAGKPLLKRIAPAVVGVLLVLLVLRWLRRRG